MLEAEMATKGILYFESTHKYKIIKREVPFLSRCIDVVMVNNQEELISIEFKINNWKHAIEQAVNHKLGADKAYICLPKRGLTDQLRDAVIAAKIGLLFYDDESQNVETVIDVPEERCNILAFKEILLNNLTKL